MAELTFERDSVSVRALKLKSKKLIEKGKYALNDFKASMTKRVDAQSIVVIGSDIQNHKSHLTARE